MLTPVIPLLYNLQNFDFRGHHIEFLKVTEDSTVSMGSSGTTVVMQAGEAAEQQPVYDVASMPGFRFQPTEEELVGFYLRSMVMGHPRLEVDLINVLDLYRYDPWELPAMAFMQGEREWLFFCPRDKKYPNGARPNRVTASGYWKATGTDRPVRRAHDSHCIGLKKTLVFYAGKAPKGRKSEWIMNEYRLPQHEQHLRKSAKDPREVALCRIYKKLAPNPSSSRFDVTTEEAVGAESSIYTLDCSDSILHCNTSPCGSTSRSSASSPKLVSFSKGPTRNVMESPDCNLTAVSSLRQQQQEHIVMQTCVKMETGTLTSPLCPYLAPDSMDALMGQLMDADIRRGRPRFAAPELGISAGVHQHELARDDRAGCSNLMMSTSLDNLLKASMRSSPLPLHDDLLPEPSSSSSFFPINQFGWNYCEPSWLPLSSTLPSVLQVQGLQHHFQ